MESLILPINIKDNSFYRNHTLGYLNNLYVAEGNTVMKSVNGVVYSHDEETLLMMPRSRTSYSVPEGVKTLSKYCFDYSNLTSLTLPASLNMIGVYAFHHTKLTTLIIPANVLYMESGAITSNEYLTTIIVNAVIPPKLASGISGRFCYANDNLTAIYVPDASVEAYKEAEGWKNDSEIIKPISKMP
jgi:hypothetical protein